MLIITLLLDLFTSRKCTRALECEKETERERFVYIWVEYEDLCQPQVGQDIPI